MNIISSKETTIAGIAAFVFALAGAIYYHYDGDVETVPNWTVVASTFFAMVGLIRARDNNKSSEQVGAK